MRLDAALIATFTAATSAFLIPADIPETIEDIKDARFRGGSPDHAKDFFHALLAQRTTTIDLACSDCPFPSHQSPEGVIRWDVGVDSVIHLNLDTHDHTFNINSHPLLPIEKAQQAQAQLLQAYLVRKDSNEQSIDVSINFAMEVMPPIPSPHREGVSLIPVEFTILALSGIPVKVNTIALKLVQPPNHEFVIVKAEEIPFIDTPGAEECEGAGAWSLCRIKAIFMGRVNSIIEATKHTTGKLQGWGKTRGHGCHKGNRPGDENAHGPPSPPPNGEPPHHRGGHHGAHRHHRHHRFGHILHQTLRFLIIPALLGIIGGLAASAIGMLLGRAIVYLYLRVYRRGERGPLRADPVSSTADEEKQGLLDDDEDEQPLPAYEDCPQYAEDESEVEQETCSSTHEKL